MDKPEPTDLLLDIIGADALQIIGTDLDANSFFALFLVSKSYNKILNYIPIQNLQRLWFCGKKAPMIKYLKENEFPLPTHQKEICSVNFDNGSSCKVVEFPPEFPFSFGILASSADSSKAICCGLWKEYKKGNQIANIGYFPNAHIDFATQALEKLRHLENHYACALKFGYHLYMSKALNINQDKIITDSFEGTGTLFGLDDALLNSNVLSMIFLDAVYKENKGLADLILENDDLFRLLPKKALSIALEILLLSDPDEGTIWAKSKRESDNAQTVKPSELKENILKAHQRESEKKARIDETKRRVLFKIDSILEQIGADFDAIEQIKIYFNIGFTGHAIEKDYVIMEPSLAPPSRRIIWDTVLATNESGKSTLPIKKDTPISCLILLKDRKGILHSAYSYADDLDETTDIVEGSEEITLDDLAKDALNHYLGRSYKQQFDANQSFLK